MRACVSVCVFFSAWTVIARIFYVADTTDTGTLSLREIRKSDIVEAFKQVDEREDINQVPAPERQKQRQFICALVVHRGFYFAF